MIWAYATFSASVTISSAIIYASLYSFHTPGLPLLRFPLHDDIFRRRIDIHTASQCRLCASSFSQHAAIFSFRTGCSYGLSSISLLRYILRHAATRVRGGRELFASDIGRILGALSQRFDSLTTLRLMLCHALPSWWWLKRCRHIFLLLCLMIIFAFVSCSYARRATIFSSFTHVRFAFLSESKMLSQGRHSRLVFTLARYGGATPRVTLFQAHYRHIAWLRYCSIDISCYSAMTGIFRRQMRCHLLSRYCRSSYCLSWFF